MAKFEYKSPQIKHFADLTLAGGGVFGAAYCGSLMAFERNEIWFKRVAGNSAGAITGCLIAAGYNASEIDYLFAPPPTMRMGSVNNKNREAPSDDVKELGQQYLNYIKFLDIPATPRSINNVTKKKTLLYKGLEMIYDKFLGPVHDVILQTDTFVDNILTSVYDAVKPPSIVLPDNPSEDIKWNGITVMQKGTLGSAQTINPPFISLSDFKTKVRQNLDETPLLKIKNLYTGRAIPQSKEDFLIDLWDLIAVEFNPLANASQSLSITLDQKLLSRMLVNGLMNLLMEGGIFNGDEFYNRIKKLMDKKKITDFNSIEAVDDFVVLATNITTGKLKIYSKIHSPTVEVAMAVRQSMSLPFIFDRVAFENEEFWDGGLIDNWPVWEFIQNNNVDQAKVPKIGLFFTDGDATQKKFSEGTCTDNPSNNRNPKIDSFNSMISEIPEFSIFRSIVKYGNFVMGGSRNVSARIMFEELKKNHPELVIRDYEILLKGYNWLDAVLSLSEFNGMACRGWNTIINHLQDPVEGLPGINVLDSSNPYS